MTAGPDPADQVAEPLQASDARAAAASPKRPVLLLAVALLAASATSASEAPRYQTGSPGDKALAQNLSVDGFNSPPARHGRPVVSASEGV